MVRSATKSPYIGWPLLPIPNGNGELCYPTLEESIRQLIEVILRTRPGEQLMRPEFGAGLERYLHEPNDLTTRRRIRDLVKEAIEQWEGRVVLDRVEVIEVADKPTHLRVEIAYRLRRTGIVQQMGISMTLEA